MRGLCGWKRPECETGCLRAGVGTGDLRGFLPAVTCTEPSHATHPRLPRQPSLFLCLLRNTITSWPRGAQRPSPTAGSTRGHHCAPDPGAHRPIALPSTVCLGSQPPPATGLCPRPTLSHLSQEGSSSSALCLVSKWIQMHKAISHG